jgi:hypothetical protein
MANQNDRTRWQTRTTERINGISVRAPDSRTRAARRTRRGTNGIRGAATTSKQRPAWPKRARKEDLDEDNSVATDNTIGRSGRRSLRFQRAAFQKPTRTSTRYHPNRWRSSNDSTFRFG